MPTKFNDTASAKWSTFGTVGTKWVWDTYGVTPKAIVGALELLDCLAYGNWVTLGDISGSTELLTCVGDASIDDSISGNIVAELELLISIGRGTTLINYITAELEPLVAEGYANMGIEATLELLQAELWSLSGNFIDASLRPITALLSGNSTSARVSAKLELLSVEAHTGSSVQVELPKLTIAATASQETVGDIIATLQYLTAKGRIGGHVSAELLHLTASLSGRTSVIANLIGEFETLYCTCASRAKVSILSNLVARMRLLSCEAYANTKAEEHSDILGVLKSLEADIVALQGQRASLVALLRPLKATGLGGPMKEAHIVGTLEYLEAELVSYFNQETCEPYGTLEFDK